MNDKNIALIDTVPTIEDLRKVPGFNPLLYVKEILYRGKRALTMPLRYKRLWFKRACPQGRIRLVERSLTDQMAVIEAQVFLDREGEAPFATFTATKVARNSQDDFLAAAKDAAMNGALESAGFGIKTEVPPTFLSEKGQGMSPAARTVLRTAIPAAKPFTQTPPAQTATPKQEAPVAEPKPAVETAASMEKVAKTEAAEAPAPAVQQAVAPMGQTVESAEPPKTAIEQQTESKAEDTAPAVVPTEPMLAERTTTQAAAAETVKEEPKEAPTDAQQPATPLSDAAALLQSIAAPAKEPEPTDAPADAPSKFDESMSVEEIRAVMTLEEAKAVVVPAGICKGWTLEQVTKQRPASLKFYAYGDESRNGRIVKAASLLLVEGPNLAQAG